MISGPTNTANPATKYVSFLYALTLLVLLSAFFWTDNSDAANVFKGGELYMEYCEDCHGANGEGVPGVPDFTRQAVLMRPDPELIKVIKEGKGAMPGYEGIIRRQELLDLVAYLRTLQ